MGAGAILGKTLKSCSLLIELDDVLNMRVGTLNKRGKMLRLVKYTNVKKFACTA